MPAKNKASKPSKPLSRTALVCGIFIATIITALLSFISPELAMLTFGVLALTGILHFENRRRAFWELATSFKFKNFLSALKEHDRDLLRHGLAIDSLKEEIKETRAAIRRNVAAPAPSETKSAVPIEDKPEAPSRELMAFLSQEKSFNRKIPKPDWGNSLPRAVRPGQVTETDYFEPQSLASDDDDYKGLSDTVVRELLHHAVTNKRVDVFVQPIVRLPQRQTRFYEIFARIRAQPGQYLPASRYLPIAEQDNLQNEIDSMLLLQCIKTIEASAHIERAAPFFLNVKSSTLKDTAFMKRLLMFLSHHRDMAPRLVFELPQAEFLNLSAPLREIIRGLGKLGCSFSLDHVTTLEFDIPELQKYKVRFVKIDAQKLRSDQGQNKAKRILEANSIGVIVQKIESETQLRALLDSDVHYGQGYLFGKPELQGAYAKRARARRSGNDEKASA